MENAEIARMLEDCADLLELRNENPFRVRAYREAAQTIRGHAIPMARMLEEGTPLTSLRGIGKDLGAKVEEIVRTGSLAQLHELSREMPATLIEITRLSGVGSKKARALWDALQVGDLKSLEEAARAGRVAGVAGFGEKTQARILKSIAERRSFQTRVKLSEADQIVQPLLEHLRRTHGIERLDVAGSYRRRRDTIGDIDLLAVARDPLPVMKAFTTWPRVAAVLGSGETRSSVTLDSGLQVDLRVVPPESYGAALVYFTGSKGHCIALRRRAMGRGLKISEYGVFRAPMGEAPAGPDPEAAAAEGMIGAAEPAGAVTATAPGGRVDGATVAAGDRMAGATEEEVYAAVGLPWIPPELRENAGELEAAAAGTLPQLVRVEDMQGDLQMHSTWSDGRNSIEQMLEGCAARGYKYFAVTDHSRSLAMTGGLDVDKLRRQWEEIREIAARHPEIRILRGMEVDILADGSLDLEDEMLAQCDLVVVSVHSRLDLPAAAQTERILRALRHPETNILAHPTGRHINRRPPMQFDMQEVLRCAREQGVAVEVNGQPDRLDLNEVDVRSALRLGVPVVISTDAHSVGQLSWMGYGVDQARRGGCAAAQVMNAQPLERLLRFLAKEA